MTLAIIALFADAPTTLTNIGSWRVKETDRLAAMATELRKIGATVEEGPDWLRVDAACAIPAGEHRDLRRPPHGDVLLARLPCGRAGDDRRSRAACARRFPEYFSRVRRGSLVRERARGPVDRRRRPGGVGQGHHRRGRRAGARLPLPRQRLAVPARGAEGPAHRHGLRRRRAARQLRGAPGRRVPSPAKILLDGEDATADIRERGRLRRGVAGGGARPAVRAALIGRQRAFRRPPGWWRTAATWARSSFRTPRSRSS